MAALGYGGGAISKDMAMMLQESWRMLLEEVMAKR